MKNHHEGIAVFQVQCGNMVPNHDETRVLDTIQDGGGVSASRWILLVMKSLRNHKTRQVWGDKRIVLHRFEIAVIGCIEPVAAHSRLQRDEPVWRNPHLPQNAIIEVKLKLGVSQPSIALQEGRYAETDHYLTCSRRIR